MPNLNKTILSLLLAAGSFVLHGQTYLFFQDSPDNGFYEYSWMELTGPSELERMPPDLRKFPVESVVAAHQGVNSLRLKWKSVDGGTWLAIAAGDAWIAKDISSTDTLIIWMQSVEGIASADLPKVFLEDVENKKGVQIPVPDWSGDLSVGVWTRIAIPMTLFLTSGDGVDYTQIKTIGFTQNAADGAAHTLLLDDMRVNVGDGSADPVTPPEHIAAKGYEYHVDISWEPSPGIVSGYQVERSLDDGTSYAAAGLVGEDDTHFIDWVKTLEDGLDLKYRVRSLDAVGTPSEPSGEVDASTVTMTDEELLDMVQAYTFRYFWDDAHEASGASRERNTSGNTVTSGGTGFGIMAIPVGIERGYITRAEGVARMLKILNFLETADRFHGAWSHWINGNTGQRIPFGTKDNGGDIVETAYVAQGLLTIRQYFDADNSDEKQIVQKATALWEGIEWDWYRQNDSPSIYWHWSPEYNWDMNMTVSGWNEAAIVYLCAIASPTHGVPASLWNTGWAQSPNYTNGYTYYGHTLYLGNGSSYGGPLFFAHYSFVGFDPRDKADAYTNYFNQNRNHSLIQQAYSKNNPKNHDGYSEICWGITASDDPDGYLAHEPNTDRDNGTITPTAALSSFPYTPDESMLALKHFYRELGEETWGWMGFYDAFNQKRDWWARSYLAIDQGPILLMIENHRTALLWDLFMANPEIQPMMDAIGFYHSLNSVEKARESQGIHVFPNPASGEFLLSFPTSNRSDVLVELYSSTGEKIRTLLKVEALPPGEHHLHLKGYDLSPGLYIIRLLKHKNESVTTKLIIN